MSLCVKGSSRALEPFNALFFINILWHPGPINYSNTVVTAIYFPKTEVYENNTTDCSMTVFVMHKSIVTISGKESR